MGTGITPAFTDCAAILDEIEMAPGHFRRISMQRSRGNRQAHTRNRQVTNHLKRLATRRWAVPTLRSSDPSGAYLQLTAWNSKGLDRRLDHVIDGGHAGRMRLGQRGRTIAVAVGVTIHLGRFGRRHAGACDSTTGPSPWPSPPA